MSIKDQLEIREKREWRMSSLINEIKRKDQIKRMVLKQNHQRLSLLKI